LSRRKWLRRKGNVKESGEPDHVGSQTMTENVNRMGESRGLGGGEKRNNPYKAGRRGTFKN